ncbi:MAG: KorB domain [Candidatus Sumerlaeota bacterium]|nr:KorB domain [Candidatus Sumerlaeota bacterium]
MKNPLVVAQKMKAAFHEDIGAKKVTQSMVAERFGVSRSRVAQYIGLLRLPDDVIAFVVADENEEYVAHLTEGNLREIAAMPDPIRQRRAFAELLSGTPSC